MRTFLILFGIFSWIILGITWVLPLKRKLLKIHGFDKSNAFFIDLAKQGDPQAKQLYSRTKILIVTGFIGGVLITISKYL